MNITLQPKEWSAQTWYNDNANRYFESTVALDMSSLYQSLQPYFQPGQSLLDIGCGSGRDSLYWAKQGCEVHAIDTSDALITLAQQQHGHQPALTFDTMNILDLPLIHMYDNMMANASLLHIPESHYRDLFQHFDQHLQPGGHFYASWKVEEGGFDAQGRFFNNYPTWHALAHMLEDVIPFTWQMVAYNTGGDTMGRTVQWHECVWKKRA